MAGGGNRRGAGSEEVRIGTGNVFAALETLKKKKKKKPAKKQEPEAVKPEVIWAPAPLNTKSWADVEDDEDDDYFATTAPLRPVGEAQDTAAVHEDDKEHSALEQEIESEDDSLDDEADLADEDEHEHEHEAEDSSPSEQAVQKTVAPLAPPKDTERQLSKKELKKKELEELDAVLAELGISDNSNNVTQDEINDKKSAGQAADGEKKEDVPAPAESKTSKKKKAKKDKSSKEAKETQDQNDVVDSDSAGAEPDEDAAAVDIKERIKKVTSMKKKKSSKELDAAAKIAASEAATRRAKLAAAKKKEKSHYNQQPLR